MSAPSGSERGGRDPERRAVPAVEDDAQPREAAIVERAHQPAHVVLGRVADLARHPDRRVDRAPRRNAHRELAELALELGLDMLGELPPSEPEQLHPVVTERVVARRDHRRRGAPLACDVGDARRRQHPHELDVTALGAEPCDEGGLEHRTRTPGVAPDHERLVVADHAHHRTTQSGDELDRQLTVRDAAETIGTKPERHGSWPV